MKAKFSVMPSRTKFRVIDVIRQHTWHVKLTVIMVDAAMSITFYLALKHELLLCIHVSERKKPELRRTVDMK